MPIKLTFHGQSAFTIENDSHSLLIDPFFTDNPVAKSTADEVKCTHIAVTHGHFDHFADCEKIAKANNATVIAAYEICEYLQSKGHELCEPGNPGGRIETPFGAVSFTIAFHSSSFDGQYMGMPCGFVIEFDGAVLYHAGDTALFSDMELIGEIYKPDLAMLPIGDRFTMGPEMAAAAAEMIGAPTAIPMHYNTWPPIEVDVKRFAPENIDVLVLEPGDAVELETE
ncbi:MAG: metal-dependent hydrolase [Phycisphaerales bacterium]|jgi:L-ascorbate metabolism protein UlaG (beta-lactamase superfamily)|nr:metal-dependent hydrolase [Phycisphaerales bacterium]